MTTKTVIDLMRSYVAVADMCDAYNKEHGTDVKPWECVRNKRFPFSLRTQTHPDFNGLTDDCLQSMELSVAILEGKPLFIGNTIYSKYPGSPVSMLIGETTAKLINDRQWTWTKRELKRTFEINGEVLPCPIDCQHDKFTLTLEGKESGFWTFNFNSSADRSAVLKTLVDALRNARDKP